MSDKQKGDSTAKVNAKPKRKRGRPRKYTDSLAQEICRQRSEGKSLRRICRSANMPTRDTVLRWKREYPDFSDHYLAAMKVWLEDEMDALVELADRATPANYAAVRVKLNTRKWIASRLLPKRFGDRLAIAGDDPPVRIRYELANLSDDELRDLERLTEKAERKSDE